MRRLARFSSAIALIASLSGTVSAASIVLTSSGSGPVVTVYMWFEDSSRNADLHSLQFYIDLPDTGNGSLAAVPDFRSAGTGRSGSTLYGPSGEITVWDLLSTVGDPSGVVEVSAVHGSSFLLDINGLATYGNCLGPADPCARQNAGLLANRIYLGSFNMNYNGQPIYYTLPRNSIFGEGDNNPQNGEDAIISELRNDSGPNRTIQGLAPTPVPIGEGARLVMAVILLIVEIAALARR